MYSASVTREEFLSTIGGKSLPNLRKGLVASKRGDREIRLIWMERPGSAGVLPQALVVDERGLGDLLAFVATYVKSIAPFTAFVKVFTSQQIDAVVASHERAALPPYVPEGLVGLVIAEAYLQTGRRSGSLATLPVQACLGTISSCALQYISAGYDYDRLPEMLNSWNRARFLLSSPDESLKVNSAVIGAVWEMIVNALECPASHDNHPAMQFIRSQIGQTSLPQFAWADLTHDLPDARDAPQRMLGSREERVRLLDRFIAVITNAELDKVSIEVAVGYLMSLVAEGSLSYLGLSKEIEEHFPAAILWYAFFTCLRTDTDVMSAGDCLGRHVITKLLPFQSPFRIGQSDISIDEIDVLVGERRTPLKVRTAHQSLVTVELYPGILGRFRLSRPSSDVPKSKRANMGEELRELKYYLRRASAALERFEGGDQPDLFDRKRPYSRDR